MTKEELAANMDNREWRLNNLYYIMDDHGKRILFKMNPIQYLLYQGMWWLNVILKSRQHGITTFLCILFLDACLFSPNVRCGIIAHKLADAKKIFRDKVLYAYENLPETLKSHRDLLKDDTEEIILANNSGVYVSTSMRSGTLQYLHVSEYGYVCHHAPSKAREIKAGAMETVHENSFLFIESTAEGIGNDFEKICRRAEKQSKDEVKLTRLDYQFFFFPWYKKPENQLYEPVAIETGLMEYFSRIESENGETVPDTYRWWYVKKVEALGIDIYKEHPSTSDEAFFASVQGTFYGDKLAQAREDKRIGNFPHDPSYPVYTFSDYGDRWTATVFVQFISGRIRIISDYFDSEGQGAPGWATVCTARGYNYRGHVAGPDISPTGGSNRKAFATGQFLVTTLQQLGYNVDPCEPHSFDDRIRIGREVWDLLEINEPECPTFLLGASGYRKKEDTQLSTPDRAEFHDGVAKTWHRHIMDAYGHLAIMYRAHQYRGDTLAGLVDYQGRGEQDAYDPYDNRVLEFGGRSHGR